MDQEPRQIYEFGEFRLDVEQGVLLQNGRSVALKPKAFEMLHVFVESRGRVVTRDELMEKLWADSFVEENNISQHVRALRKALGEGENGNKFIETLPRRGFRFLPEVRIVEAVGIDGGVPFKNNGDQIANVAPSDEPDSEALAVDQTKASHNYDNISEANTSAIAAPENSAIIKLNDEPAAEVAHRVQSEIRSDKNTLQITRRRRGLRRGSKSLVWGLSIGFVFLVLGQILRIFNVMVSVTPNSLSEGIRPMIESLLGMLLIPVGIGYFAGIALLLFGAARMIYAFFEREDSRWTSSLFEKITAAAVIGIIVAVAVPNLIYSYRQAKEFRQNQAATQSIRSVAVLPLKSHSSNADDEELRIRITDALITRLGGMKDVAIRPTDSVLRFAKSEESILDIGKKLKVDAVLDGRVQREGENVRVTLQLVRIINGNQIWSEQFDGRENKILDLQDAIAARVVQTLSQNREHVLEVDASPTKSTEAYEAYLKARYFVRQMKGKEALDKAIYYYEQAIELDPKFAESYGGLAGARFRLYSGGFDTSRENIIKAKEDLQKALAIDPDGVEASVTLGNIQMLLDWDWRNSEATFKRIVESAPNSVGARIYYGVLLTHLRRFDEAQIQLEQAVKLDPVYAGSISNLGMVYYCKKDYLQAEQQFRKALEFDEKWVFAHMMMWNCLWMQGKKAESIEYIVRSLDSAGNVRLARKIEEQARTSKPEDVIRFIISELSSSPMKPNSYSLAVWTMSAGDEEDALNWLEKAFEEHLPWTVAIASMPNFEPLRDERRFQEILRKMNLE